MNPNKIDIRGKKIIAVEEGHDYTILTLEGDIKLEISAFKEITYPHLPYLYVHVE